MREDCPPPESWLPRVGEGGIGEELAAHLAACPDCRADARALLEEAAPRHSWIRPAAAAALLLSACAYLAARRSAGPAPSPSLPASKVAADPRRLWLRAPASLDTPFGRLALERGQAGVRLEENARAASLWREAWASEPGCLRLALLDGALARLGRDRWTGPCRVRVDASGAKREALDEASLAEALSWRDGEGGWTELGSASLGVPRPEARDWLFPVPGQVRALVMEAEIREPAFSQTALCYPSGGGTASSSLDAGGAWRTVRLRLDEERLEILSGSSVLVSAPVPRDGRRISERPQLGLRVWQGPVEVKGLRWRPLP